MQNVLQLADAQSQARPDLGIATVFTVIHNTMIILSSLSTGIKQRHIVSGQGPTCRRKRSGKKLRVGRTAGRTPGAMKAPIVNW